MGGRVLSFVRDTVQAKGPDGLAWQTVDVDVRFFFEGRRFLIGDNLVILAKQG